MKESKALKTWICSQIYDKYYIHSMLGAYLYVQMYMDW